MKRKIYYPIIALLSIMGIWALAVRVAQGLQVTALTSYVAWGMWVSVYIYFIGLSAGSFLLSTMIYVFGMHQLEKVGRVSLLTALFSLVAGLLFIWIDLGHMERFSEIFTRPHFTSLMTIESYLYLGYIVLILAELWLLLRNDLAALRSRGRGWKRGLYRILALGYTPPSDREARQRSETATRRWITGLGILGIPTAIGVHGGTGAIFAVAIARPYWNSGLFPIVFLVSALASGAGLVTFLYAALGRRDAEFPEVLKKVSGLAVLFIGVDLLLVLSEIVVGLYGGVPSQVEVFRAIMSGRFPYVFWIGQIGLAGVIPMLVVAIASREAAQPRAATAKASRRRVPALTPIAAVAGGLIVAGDVWNVLSGRVSGAFVGESAGGLGFSAAFWVAQLVLLVCIVALLSQRWGSSRFWLATAGICTVAGILAVRLTIVIPGFVVPVLENLQQAYQDSRLAYSYFPSVLEWASTFGLIALIVLLFSLAYEVLPVYGREEETR